MFYKNSTFTTFLKSTFTLVVGFALLGFTGPMNSTDDSGSESAKVIEVSIGDLSYSPDEITVPAGEEVTLKISNNGSAVHEFRVGKNLQEDGFGKNLFEGVQVSKSKKSGGQSGKKAKEKSHARSGKMLKLKPGQSGKLTFTLPDGKAGNYTVACFEETGGQKHHEKGMKASLVVQ